MKTQKMVDKRFYIAFNGILAEDCARKFAAKLRKHKMKIRTAAIPTSVFGNTVFFRDYWIEVDEPTVSDWWWILIFGSWYTGEYKRVCNIYGYREVEYGNSMEECWKKVYKKR